MPLSKARNKERMKQFRLHNQRLDKPVQPKTVKILHGGKYIDVIKPELDADGNEIPEY